MGVGLSTYQLIEADAVAGLSTLAPQSINCCITSPPYFGLRDYGVAGQIGLEASPAEYVARIVGVFRSVRRVLRDDGTLWLNLGDSYANDAKWGGSTGGKHVSALHGAAVGRGKRHTGLKPKDLIGIPWRVAFALQEDGWYLRQDIIWHKPNPMPESVTDRCTKAHEYLFLLTKGSRYFYDNAAVFEPLCTDIRENYPARARITGRGTQGAAEARGNDRDKSGGFPPSYKGSSFNRGKSKDSREQTGAPVGEGERMEAAGRNKRSVWTIATEPYPEAHFATFPRALVDPCVLAGCPEGGTVLDPFNGSGTTGAVALARGRNYIGIEINPAYVQLATKRLGSVSPLFCEVAV